MSGTGPVMTNGGDAVHLTLDVARRHYLDGWTKKQIGDHFDLSRFQVARMLQRALDRGWVKIEITSPAELDAELGDRVRLAFGLRHARIARGDGNEAATRQETAASAAQLLEDTLSPDDVLGLAWSRCVAATVDRLSSVPRVSAVQLTGALPQADPDGGSIELVRRFAAVSRGSAYLYYAPMILPDEATAGALRRQPDVARTIELTSTVTTAVVAVGAWHAGASTIYDALTPLERHEAEQSSVVGEISGVFVDADGTAPALSVSRRMLCPSAAQLAAMDHVVAVVSGPGRAEATLAALRSGLISSLVTGVGEACELLALVDG